MLPFFIRSATALPRTSPEGPPKPNGQVGEMPTAYCAGVRCGGGFSNEEQSAGEGARHHRDLCSGEDNEATSVPISLPCSGRGGEGNSSTSLLQSQSSLEWTGTRSAAFGLRRPRKLFESGCVSTSPMCDWFSAARAFEFWTFNSSMLLIILVLVSMTWSLRFPNSDSNMIFMSFRTSSCIVLT